MKKEKQKGLILLELVVSMGIFLAVMTIGMGALLTMYGVNKKSQTLKTIMTDLNFAVETMTREIVVGKNYHCEVGEGNDPYDPRSCDVSGAGGASITFCSSDQEQIFYRYNSGAIQRYIVEDPNPDDDVGTCESGNPGTKDWVTITSLQEVNISEDMRFYVFGAEESEVELQPRVLIVIRGTAGTGTDEESEFNIQTSLSQRSPKVPESI